MWTTSTGGFADRTRMIVRPQLAWFSPSQRHAGASKTCRTNQPMTKLCVTRRSCLSPIAGVRNSWTASSIWARPASISASVTEPKNESNALGMSGVGPDGMQSNSRLDGSGSSDGMRSAMMDAVCSARTSGEWYIPVNGTPLSRSATSWAWRLPRGESGPSGRPCSASCCSP